MVEFEIFFSKQADKDKKLIKQAGFENKVRELINILYSNPFQNPPPYETLTGNLKGYYSRRINVQHRLVYQVLKEEKAVKIIRMWTHYE